MPTITPQSADVRYREINLSRSIAQSSSASAGLLVVSAQGREGLFHITSPGNFLAEYGNPNAQISFSHYAALDYLREGDSLWCRRVFGASGVAYSAAILDDNGSGVTELTSINAGIPNLTTPSWAALAPNPKIPLLIFYPEHGPGSYANNISIRIRSQNLPAPAAPSVVNAASGGVLAAATYNYRIAALSARGTNLASTVGTVVVASGTTNAITLTWAAVPGAIGYKVYGRTGATPTLLTTVGGATLTYLDDGSLTPGSEAYITNPVNLAAAVTTYDLDVFDTTISASNPVESFKFSLTKQIDASGVQLEATQRINPFSAYVNVLSNVTALGTVPELTGTTAIVPLAGGASGTAPTNSHIELAWDDFADREIVDVDLLINSGFTNVAVQQKMDAIASGRGNCVALLDIPPTLQRAQDMTDWRLLTQNINSSFSALFGPDVLESDPYNGNTLYVPFTGWAAGLCARTDRVADPWFAIAGLNRGLVGVLGTRYKYTDAERTMLFKAQINYTRNFVGNGIALWEQMTLDPTLSALSWLNVRRLVNIIKKSTYLFLLYSVHEPNDDFSRKALVQNISDYLTIVKNARGIQSFLVVANADNNPPELTNVGILKVTVFITPTLPIHEIQVDMVITKQGVNFSEINIANLG